MYVRAGDKLHFTLSGPVDLLVGDTAAAGSGGGELIGGQPVAGRDLQLKLVIQ